LLVLLPGVAWSQEKKDAPPEPIKVVELKRTEPVSYEKDVEPILYKKCISCHSGPVKEAKLDLGSYEGLVKGGKRGSSLVPGKAGSSLIYKCGGRTQKPLMPPKDEVPLSPEELALIKLWIEQGAKAPSGVRVRPKVIVGLPPGNLHPVRALAVSPDKSTVVVGRSNQIHVFDGLKGAYIRTLYEPGLKTPDGKAVKAAHLSIVEAMAFSPDGKYLASGSFQEVSLWDVQTGQLRHKITGFADRVVALAFSNDSKRLATGGGAPTEDGEIKVFEVPSWKLVCDIKNGHSDTVYGVSISPDGTKLATCSADKYVKVFELPSGKYVKTFEGHTHHVLDVGWKNDGKKLASAGADNVVKVWDYEKGEKERDINAHQKQVTRLLFLGKTNQFATVSGDAQVRYWNVDNGGNTRNFGGFNDFLYAIGTSQDGAVLAAGGEEGVVRLYNGNTGAFIRALQPPEGKPTAKK
jgi:hypothetical protein